MSIANAVHHSMIGGKRLPYDAEVEYLESTGTQWIDTGVNAETPLECHLTASFTKNQGNVHLVGAANTSYLATKALYILGEYPSGKFFTRLGNVYTSYGALSTGSVFTADISMKVDDLSATIDGVKTLDTVGQEQQNVGAPIYLFALNRNGVAAFNSPARIYNFRIVVAGVLARDSIPVRVGTVGYLYDRVTGKLFGNAGTGDFVLGPDKN